MDNLHRIFIAFPVSEEAKNELEATQQELAELNKKAHIKWTSRGLFHVTLEFIGEIDENQIQVIKDILQDISKNHSPFKYWLDRIDAFPNKNRPNIIVVRTQEEHKVGHGFHEEMVERLRKVNLLHKTHDWNPHITIGRNKRHERVEGLHSVEIENVVWQVDKIELIESELTYDGPVYNIIETYNLIVD